jgi:peptide/nickel transport system permease protein
VGLLAVVALLSPLLATDQPLLSRSASGLHAPALAGYPVFGRWFRALEGEGGTVLLRAPVPYSPYGIALSERLSAPSARHWMGTDDLGRDVLARVIAASPVSLSVGLSASGLALLLGLSVGGLAAARGGLTDILLSRLIDVVLCFPTIFLILALVAVFPPSLWTVVLAIALTSWPNEARYARAEILKAREMDYVRAAVASGIPPVRILRRHLLPNALPPVLVSATFGVAGAILAEAALSFLGVGVPPPQPSWGGILALSQEYLDQAWWLALFPGLAIFLTVSSYNLIGEAWRVALDPQLAIEPGGLAGEKRLAGEVSS